MCARWLEQHPERRVIVCELEHLETRQQLWSALGEALGLRELVQLTSDEANAQILKALEFCEPSVLILDNFEQLTPHGDLLLEWISVAPQLKVLVTTRHRLQLRGERGQLLEGLDQEQGRALFARRAEELLGFFDPDEEELAAVDRLIEYFDGMPLPIELCASQLLMRSVINITESLEQEALDMQNAWADVPQRQRSLRDAMSTTWALLDESTRVITSRFALFRGAFSIKDAQPLCQGINAPIPPVLLTLRNHSLIRPIQAGRGAPMFKLSAIARQYAREVYADSEPEHIPSLYAEQALATCLESLERAERTGKEEDRAIFWARSTDLHAIAAGDVRGLEPSHIARGGLLLQQAQRRLKVLGRDVEVELHRLERLAPRLEDHPEFQLEIAIERAWADLSSGVLSPEMLDSLEEKARSIDFHHALGDSQQLRARIAAEDVRLTDALAHELSAREHYRVVENRTLEAQVTLDALLFSITSLQTGITTTPDADTLLTEAERLCARLRHDVFEREIDYLRALLMSARGQLEEAISRARVAIERARERGDRRDEIRWLRQYHYWNIRVGDQEDAMRLGHEYITLSKRLGLYTVSIVIQQALAMLDIGQHDEAKALLDEEIDLSSPSLSTYARAPAHVIRGLHALFSLDPERGLIECDKAIKEYRSNDARSGLAFALGIRSVAHQLLGETNDALDDLEESRGLLDPERAQDRTRLLAIECFELTRQPDPEARKESLTALAERTRVDIVSRLAHQLVSHLAGEFEEGALDAPEATHDLQVAHDATWFELPDEERVDLKRRKALRLILAELVQRYRDEPGQGMSMYELIEVGWPDENLDLESGTNRVRAAIHTLRSLGLRGFLVNLDGYMLDQEKEILVVL